MNSFDPATHLLMRATAPALLALGSGAATDLPTDLQWMPPGRLTVQPITSDKPFEMAVTEAIAAKAQADLRAMLDAEKAGRGSRPFGDFNHSDGEAAFDPVEFRWAGEDPKTGGVRLKVKWTPAGEAAVRAGAWRYLSPSWWMDKATSAFRGVGLNVGGLVNRPAFNGIQAFARAGASLPNQNQNPTMLTPEEKQQIETLAGSVTKLTETVTSLASTFETFKGEVTKATAKGQAGPAPEIVSIEARLKALETSDQTLIQSNARKTVEELGVKAGRIASQDKDTIDFWTGAIAQNAKAADALGKMPVNPAFLTVVQAGAAGAGNSGQSGTEHAFVAKARDFAKANNLTDAVQAQAKFAATAEGRELYIAYATAMRAGTK